MTVPRWVVAASGLPWIPPPLLCSPGSTNAQAHLLLMSFFVVVVTFLLILQGSKRFLKRFLQFGYVASALLLGKVR